MLILFSVLDEEGPMPIFNPGYPQRRANRALENGCETCKKVQ